MILMLLAAQFSAPQPLNLKYWFDYTDVPAQSLRVNKLYVVGFSLTVSRSGKVRDCRIDFPSGSREVDSLSCSLPKRRARFKPAYDAQGLTADGVYRTYTHWIVADRMVGRPSVFIPIMSVTVDRLPPGAKSPAPVRVMFTADSAGRPLQCAEEPRFSSLIAENPKGLVQAACDQLMKRYVARPVVDERGVAIPSVQNAVVAFVSKSTS